MQILESEQFLAECRNSPIVDVRSPAEYAKGHIPEAVNIPLFDNDERAVVGTIYTKTGRQEAIQKGLDIVGPKMSAFIREVGKITSSGKLLIYCWRGGMRSESMAWLFEHAGFQCATLKGGYKAYRNYLLENTGNISRLIVVDGFSGSGKTEILNQLKIKGEQVIDLENIAHHKGSVFGGIGQPEKPTSQQFQNNLFHEILKLDPTRNVWIEAESKTIGKVFLPQKLWDRMNRAITIELIVSREKRVNRLAQEYSNSPKDEMVRAIFAIGKRIGEVRKNVILNSYEDKNYENVAEMLLDYYDKLYQASRQKTGNKRIIFELPGGNVPENAGWILKKLNEHPVYFD